MKNTEKYKDKEWEKIASLISGETEADSDILKTFREDDYIAIEKNWNEIGKMGKDKNINIDKAWGNIYSRIEENGLLSKTGSDHKQLFAGSFLRIAATVLIVIGVGATMFYLFNHNTFSAKHTLATNATERNKEILLPDGSKVFLNRNSQISYYNNARKFERNVTLRGEAFFDIRHDASKPFTIDAANANVKVLGTSFSVLTNNSKNEVEVFVKTGKVMLSNNSGSQKLTLEPGFIGTVDQNSSSKTINENPNYLAWNTDLLVYDGSKLKVVFSDLKKVFDIDVVADNPEILNESITTTFEKEPEETIIRIICSTFNFSYKKEGSVYHLSKK